MIDKNLTLFRHIKRSKQETVNATVLERRHERKDHRGCHAASSQRPIQTSYLQSKLYLTRSKETHKDPKLYLDKDLLDHFGI